jgi:hypothetical protein
MVIARLSIVVGTTPLSFDQAFVFQSVKRREHCSRIELECSLGDLLQTLYDPKPMHRYQRERFENHQIKCSLRDIRFCQDAFVPMRNSYKSKACQLVKKKAQSRNVWTEIRMNPIEEGGSVGLPEKQ